MPTQAEIGGLLQDRFQGAVHETITFRGDVTCVVDKHSLVEICRFLRDDQQYDFLSDITCVDWLDRSPRFDIVYQLGSMQHWGRFRLKVRLDPDDTVATVIPIWGAANWAEREVWDLFGVVFEGHPEMRRLLLPDGWVGHPLRKDYPQSQVSLPRPKTDKTAR